MLVRKGTYVNKGVHVEWEGLNVNKGANVIF